MNFTISCQCCFQEYSIAEPGIQCVTENHWFCKKCAISVFTERVSKIHRGRFGDLYNCFTIQETSEEPCNFKDVEVFRYLTDIQKSLVILQELENRGYRKMVCCFCSFTFLLEYFDESPYVSCFQCRMIMCMRCSNPYHGQSLCDVPPYLAEMKKVGAVICPNVRCVNRYYVEVKEGCNRLLCSFCDTSYCATCNADLCVEGYSHFCGVAGNEFVDYCTKKGCDHKCVFQGKRTVWSKVSKKPFLKSWRLKFLAALKYPDEKKGQLQRKVFLILPRSFLLRYYLRDRRTIYRISDQMSIFILDFDYFRYDGDEALLFNFIKHYTPNSLK